MIKELVPTTEAIRETEVAVEEVVAGLQATPTSITVARWLDLAGTETGFAGDPMTVDRTWRCVLEQSVYVLLRDSLARAAEELIRSTSFAHRLHLRAATEAATPHGPRHVGIEAWEEVRDDLDLTNADAAELAGLSEQTYYAWKRHPESVPRPATMARLLRLRAALRSLDRTLGEGRAHDWLRTGSPAPLQRLRRSEEYETVLSEIHAVVRSDAMERLASGRPAVPPSESRGEGGLLQAQRIESNDP